MSISFNEIPNNIRTPGVYSEIDNSLAIQGLVTEPHVSLIVGQGLPAGTVAEGVPTLIQSGVAAEGYWGRHSHMAIMAHAYKAQDPLTELWGISLDDAAGTPAAGKITFTGTATAAGVVNIYLAGHRIPVVVAVGATDSEVCALAAINIQAFYNDALNGGIPVTVAVNGVNDDELDITARNDGTIGNELDIALNDAQGEEMPAGITAAIVAMASGATDPTMATVVTAMGDVQYHTIISSLSDDTNLDLLEAELATRWTWDVLKEGQCFAGRSGSQGTLTTYGNARNSKHTTVMGTGLSPSAPFQWAAIVGAISAYQTQLDPARPRQTLPLKIVLPPQPAERFTRAERNILLTDGIATFTVSSAGVCQIERLITTYQTNGAALPDTSYLDETTMRNLASIRYQLRARILAKYPRHKLANDGQRFPPGQAVVTPSIIKSEYISVLFVLQDERAQVENVKENIPNLIVVRNSSDPDRLDAQIVPDLINGARVFGNKISFKL